MFKMFMNEPYATRHELAQARRLVDLLSREFSASDVHVWLCLNFSFGGKSIDGALITPEKFAILEFKAVGGDVDCGASLENSQWVWRDYPHDDGHVIATPPYANPFSQAKNYRTAIVGGFEQRQRGFLRSTTLLKAEIKFAWWVKCCVLMSRRDASDVRVNVGELSYGTKKWFCCGTLGNAVHLMEGLESSVKMAPKEVDRLIENVLGLRHVDTVLEEVSIESGSQPVQLPSIVSMSPIEQFRKRYRSEGKEPLRNQKRKTESFVTGDRKMVTNFVDLDKLLNKPGVTVSAKGSNMVHAKVLAAKKSFECEYLKMTLSGEMAVVVPEYGTVKEFEGEDAVKAVSESCPKIGTFEVSKVLRYGPSISEDDKDKVLTYFEQKYTTSRRWYCIAYVNGNVDFVFGKKMPEITETTDSSEEPFERPISENFLMARWVREFVEKEVEGLPHLSVAEVQRTANLSDEDVRRYAKTYLPRSCAESFVVIDWMLGDEMIPQGISVLDVGCGCGGATLGCLLALHKHASGMQHKIHIEGVDVNPQSLAFAESLIKGARPFFSNLEVDFVPNKCDMMFDLSSVGGYDIVIASKSIGEAVLVNDPVYYTKMVKALITHVKGNGMMVLIDIPKHREALESATTCAGNSGFEGWVKKMSISLQGTEDSEEFICACLTRGASGIRKE